MSSNNGRRLNDRTGGRGFWPRRAPSVEDKHLLSPRSPSKRRLDMALKTHCDYCDKVVASSERIALLWGFRGCSIKGTYNVIKESEFCSINCVREFFNENLLASLKGG